MSEPVKQFMMLVREVIAFRILDLALWIAPKELALCFAKGLREGLQKYIENQSEEK